MADSLPNVDPEVLKIARESFIEELKSSMEAEFDKLEDELDLPNKLRNLEELAQDADRRANGKKTKRKKTPGKGKGKEQEQEQEEEEDEKDWDVWRKDLDIKTAIHAKGIPAQKDRIRRMEDEYAAVSTFGSYSPY